MSRLTGVLRCVGRVSGGISKPTTAQVEEYTGDYEFTPTRSTQVIEIANKKQRQTSLSILFPKTMDW